MEELWLRHLEGNFDIREGQYGILFLDLIQAVCNKKLEIVGLNPWNRTMP
jgi:hypothetical protein